MGGEEGGVGLDLFWRWVLGRVERFSGVIVVPSMETVGSLRFDGSLGRVEGCFGLGAVDVFVGWGDAEGFSYTLC